MGGVSYGQTITIDPTTVGHALSSHIIGVCRNNTYVQTTWPSQHFPEKLKKYANILPKFGNGRKLYRFGGSMVDGQYSQAYGTYGWEFGKDYGTGWPNTYPYDNFEYYLSEALELDADLMIGVNVGGGGYPNDFTINESLQQAEDLVEYLFTHNDNDGIKLIDRVVLFELGNELSGSWQKGHKERACSPDVYLQNASLFIEAMANKAHQYDSNYQLPFALMGSYNYGIEWETPNVVIKQNNPNEWEAVMPSWVVFNTATNSYDSPSFDWHFNWTPASSGGAEHIYQGTIPPTLELRRDVLPSGPVNEFFASWVFDASYACNDAIFESSWESQMDTYLEFNTNTPYNFIALHGYPPISLALLNNETSGPLSCNGEMMTDKRAAKSLFALNTWAITDRLKPIQEKFNNTNVQIANTEYASHMSHITRPDLVHSITEAMLTADHMMTAIKLDIPVANNYSFFMYADQANDNTFNLMFEPDLDQSGKVVPKPVFYVHKMIAENMGEKMLEDTETGDEFGTLSVNGCADNLPYVYPKLSYVSTIDPDGTIYTLLINRTFGDEGEIITVDFDIPGYSGELMSLVGSSITDDQCVPSQFQSVNLSGVVIEPLSINILKLTPATCHDYVIDTDVTWPNAAYPGPYGRVQVKDGATLTINSGYEARFCTEGSLDISSGSQVDLHGTLTADDVHWKGVIVRGLASAGRFNGFNTGVIEKADVGIQTQPDGPANYSKSTINCEGTTFLNNEQGMVLSMGAHNATFKQCTFKNTTAYNHPAPFHSFVELAFLGGGINYKGCSFTDERGDAFWGQGIRAYDARFSVVSDGPVISRFSRLTTAVSVNNIFFSPPASINNSQFDFCGIGVSNIGVTGIDISHNRFNFESEYVPAGGGWFNQYQYGVLMSNGIESFVLEDNDFDLISCYGSGLCRKIGAQLSYLGTTPNVVRGNRFKNNVFANHAIGENGYLPDGVGLLYECNTMTHNEVDFLTSHDPVIKIEQGRYVPLPTDGFIPPKNTFAANGTYSWDFYHGLLSNVPDVDYYHRNTAAETPNHFSGIVPIITGLVNDGCAEFTGKPGKDLTEAEREKNLKSYLESQLNYETAKAEMKTAQESGDEVLAKQKRKETSYYATEKWKYANIGYMASLYDKKRENRNEIRTWIRRFGTFEGDLMLASDFAGTEEWASVQQTLDMLAQKYELSESDYQEIRNYEAIFYILSREPVTDLSAASQEWLDDLAESGVGYASGKARSIMGLYDKVYQPLVADGLAFGIEEENGKEEETTKMLISPNPADYNMTFDWSAFVIGSDKSVKIEITNKAGALVQVLQPAVGQTVLEWTTELVPSGINYYRLLIDGEELDSGQLFINK